MAHLKTQMDFLAKHLLSDKTEMIKVMDAQGIISIVIDAEDNYVSNLGDFRGNSQGKQGRTFYDKPNYKDREQGHWRRNNDRSGLYVPPGSRDAATTSSDKMSMKDMMEKLLKGVEATN